MASEMLQRAGQALEAAWNASDRIVGDRPPIEFTPQEAQFLARAVIEALREPTAAMTRAFPAPVQTHIGRNGGTEFWPSFSCNAGTAWHRMIDAALEDAG